MADAAWERCSPEAGMLGKLGPREPPLFWGTGGRSQGFSCHPRTIGAWQGPKGLSFCLQTQAEASGTGQ